MENKTTKEPLLYIAQPTLEKPAAFMQQNYSSLIKTKHILNEQTAEKKRPNRQLNPFVDLLERDIEHEEIIERKQIKEHDKDKRFNELTIQEKIDYFINLPVEMPKMRSEIELENDVYRGYILEDNGEEITLKTGRTVETIKKERIKNIILIGF